MESVASLLTAWTLLANGSPANNSAKCVLFRSPNPIVAERTASHVRHTDWLDPTIELQWRSNAQQGKIIPHTAAFVGLMHHDMGNWLYLCRWCVASAAQETCTHLVMIFGKVDDAVRSGDDLMREEEKQIIEGNVEKRLFQKLTQRSE